MISNLEQLKRVALAATPGPWEWSIDSGNYIRMNGQTVYFDPFKFFSRLTTEFIAAWNPQTALALIERIEGLEGEKKKCRIYQNSKDGNRTKILGVICENCAHDNSVENVIYPSLESELSRYKRAVEMINRALVPGDYRLKELNAILEGK